MLLAKRAWVPLLPCAYTLRTCSQSTAGSQSAVQSCYEVLGVAETASTVDIKRAFREKAKRHHPDVATGILCDPEVFLKVVAAYEVLVDPKERSLHDEALKRRAGVFSPAAAAAAAAAQASQAHEGSHTHSSGSASRSPGGVAQELQHGVRYGWGEWLASGPRAPTQHLGGGPDESAGPTARAMYYARKYQYELEVEVQGALLHAFYGPRVTVAAGQLPPAFEAEERSCRSVSADLLHLTSGRTLLGRVTHRHVEGLTEDQLMELLASHVPSPAPLPPTFSPPPGSPLPPPSSQTPLLPHLGSHPPTPPHTTHINPQQPHPTPVPSLTHPQAHPHSHPHAPTHHIPTAHPSHHQHSHSQAHSQAHSLSHSPNHHEHTHTSAPNSPPAPSSLEDPLKMWPDGGAHPTSHRPRHRHLDMLSFVDRAVGTYSQQGKPSQGGGGGGSTLEENWGRAIAERWDMLVDDDNLGITGSSQRVLDRQRLMAGRGVPPPPSPLLPDAAYDPQGLTRHDAPWRPSNPHTPFLSQQHKSPSQLGVSHSYKAGPGRYVVAVPPPASPPPL